tara:strand:+ start:2648 stop:3226 length:579 start_codon:yes stop_codon:yes gene_type:complete
MSKTKISIILGCMYSGKSTELVRRASRYRAVGISTLIINHVNDTRTGLSVRTHSGTKLSAIKLDKLMGLFDEDFDFEDEGGYQVHWWDMTVIAIDEAHFFPDLLEFVKEIEKHNKVIIISGLDGDYKREPIGDILKVIPLCDDVVKLTALDMVDRDGSEAIFSKRIVESDDQILVGAQESYIAVSRKNYLSK